MTKIWQFVITAVHILENLATELYENPGDCLQEIVRNGLVACMPGGIWAPKLGFVEVFLVDNHPLAPKTKSLVVLDHGTGFTEPAIKLYSTIGRAAGDKGDKHSGAAQKRIGRFAALALNSRCMNDSDTSTGFYILTRTSAEGPVTMVSMIPDEIEENGGALVPKTISASSSELGPQKGIKGPFTAIVVPYSVFENYDQIREAIKWHLPRKAELMYRLEVGGKRMEPPALANKVSVVQDKGRIEAYFDRVKDRDDPDGGIWFTDADTGLRVASARAIGQQRLPYPLWKQNLVGDIFVPGLLSNQGTSRSGLSPRYLSSAAWQKVVMYLLGHVVPPAKTLLGDDDVFGRDSASKSLLSFVEQCERIWGKAESIKGGTGMFDAPTGTRGSRPGSNITKNPGSRGTQLNPSPNRNGKMRAIPIRIGDRVFVLDKRPMDDRVYAEVDMVNNEVIHINDQEYRAMPTTREARDEHILLKVLEAAAAAELTDPMDIKYFVAERRAEIAGRKK